MERGHVVSVSGNATLLTEAVSWTLEQAEVVPTLEVRRPPPGVWQGRRCKGRRCKGAGAKGAGARWATGGASLVARASWREPSPVSLTQFGVEYARAFEAAVRITQPDFALHYPPMILGGE